MIRPIIPKRAMAFDGEAVKKREDAEAEIAERQVRTYAQMGRFQRFFGDHLTGEQMNACLYLQRMMEIEAGSGNAAQSYDGVPAPTTFGGKTYSDRTLEAVGFVVACRKAVTSYAQQQHVSAWKAIEKALQADLTPQQLGEYYRIWTGQGRNRDERRIIAVRVIQAAADSVLRAFNERR